MSRVKLSGYNLRRLPAVLLVRMPVLLPFVLLARLGKLAEAAFDVVDPYLPRGLETEADARARCRAALQEAGHER